MAISTQTQTTIVVSLDWLDAFAGQLESDGRSARTIQAYCQDVRAFAAWFVQVNGQALSPELITGVDLRAWRQHHLDSKAAPATWNRRRATLSILCRWAQKAGYLSYDPFQGVKPLAEVELPPRWLTNAEYHRLVRQMEISANVQTTAAWRVQGVRNQAMLGLMLWAGLRE